MSLPPLPGTLSLADPAVETGRILIVSNRLPLTATRQGEATVLRQSSGGLASGLREVARHWPVVWFGWTGMARESRADPIVGCAETDSAVVPIPLSETDIGHYYRSYSNNLLWPVLHGWTDQLAPQPEDWATYIAVNRRFARVVARHLQPGDRVWIHDYHLMLVPRLLRELRPDARIAFFLHTPFPEPHTFETIPQSRDLLEGLMGADVIGFHTRTYARQFLAAASARLSCPIRDQTVDAGDRSAEIRVGPMGIDVASFAGLAADPNLLAEVSRLRANSGCARLLGVDRLDYTKGIAQRLIAFERLLVLRPELQRRVTLVQIAVPSREEICAYQDLREHVESIVQRINATHGRGSWTPIEYFYGTVDLFTLVALYRAADVMLVTPLRDGMNLVAKEFVATRIDHDGVLILSKFAGAADELHEALLVNPNRTDELAASYHTALTMTLEERRKRMRSLRQSVESNNLFHWATHFLEALPAFAPL